MASLYQSSSTVSPTFTSLESTVGITFMTRAPSRQAAQQDGGIALGINPPANAAPFDRHDARPLIRFSTAATFFRPRQPTGPGRRRAATRHHAHPATRLLRRRRYSTCRRPSLTKPITLLSSMPRKRRLLVCCNAGFAPPRLVQPGDIGFDVAGLVPVPDLDLVFLGIEIFFAARDRFVFEQFEAVIDAVSGGQRRRQRGART